MSQPDEVAELSATVWDHKSWCAILRQASDKGIVEGLFHHLYRAQALLSAITLQTRESQQR